MTSDKLAPATYALDLGVHRAGAGHLHFQVVNLIANLHVLEHVAGKLRVKCFNFFFQVYFSRSGFHRDVRLVVQQFKVKKVSRIEKPSKLL